MLNFWNSSQFYVKTTVQKMGKCSVLFKTCHVWILHGFQSWNPNFVLFWTLFCNLYFSINCNLLIGLVGKGFTNALGDLGSIPGHIIPKILKMVLDSSLLNTQQYKVCIKDKVEQSRERSSALLLHLGVVAIEKGAF